MGSAILCLFFHQRITRKNGKNGICRHSPLLPTEYQFKVSEGKKKQYTIVKKHLDEADTIIITTDGDREGEAIARLIINLSGNNQKQLKRLWINSLENRFWIVKNSLHSVLLTLLNDWLVSRVTNYTILVFVYQLSFDSRKWRVK